MQMSDNKPPQEVSNPSDSQVDEWVSEQQWHIENATVDVTQFMQPLAPGVRISDATVYTLDGQAQSLASLWADKPVLIVTGSLSCPPSRQLNPGVNAVMEKYGERFNCVVLYVIDAHPSGDPCPYTGTDWLTKDNESDGIRLRQPQVQAERNELAQRYSDLLGIQVPLLVGVVRTGALAECGGFNR